MRPPRLIHDAEHSNGQIGSSKALIESSQKGHQDLYQQRPWNQQLAVPTSSKFEHGEGETLRILIM